MSYGYCSKCGARGVSRERRINGNDTCENGCVYPSSESVHKKPMTLRNDITKAICTTDIELGTGIKTRVSLDDGEKITTEVLRAVLEYLGKKTLREEDSLPNVYNEVAKLLADSIIAQLEE